MLDTAGKMLERLLLQRLDQHLDTTEGGRSDRQYGFRKGRSTVDAIRAVMEVALRAAEGHFRDRKLCALVSLDVKNAFNTAPWACIDDALRRKKVPAYLVKTLRSYMTDRTLLVGESRAARPVSCGVPQGSVLGPALWNVLYDGLLETVMPKGITVVSFADDVAVIGTARMVESLETRMNDALDTVAGWMVRHGLELAPQKSEALMLTRKRSRPPALIVCGHVLPIQTSIRYLGVELDRYLTFTKHVANASSSASQAASAIGRLMPNVGGPSTAKRRLLQSVTQSKLLYAAPVWGLGATTTAKNRNSLIRAQRLSALRIARCYRTVSDAAALVVADMIPADLIARERALVAKRLQTKAPGEEPSSILLEEVERTALLRQARWDESSKGAWTKRLLPDLDRWRRKLPETVITFHLSQALTGHGCFRSYLWSRKRASNPRCLYCQHPEDTAEHTLFFCPHWQQHRWAVGSTLGGRDPRPEDVADLLCGPVGLPSNHREAAGRACREFQKMVEDIMTRKEEDERCSQEERRATLRRHPP